MGKSFRFGLRTEIILSLILLMLAAVILISVVVIKVTEKNILEQKLESGQIIIDSLRNSIESILEEDSKAFQNEAGVRRLKRLVKLFTRKNSFTKLFILNKKNEIIVHSNSKMTGHVTSDRDIKEAMFRGKVVTRISDGNRWLYRGAVKDLTITAPVHLRSDIVGVIRGRISLADVQESIIQSQRIVLIYIIFDSIVIVVFGSILLSRVIVRPIKELLNTTEKIAEGDFSHILKNNSVNEIGKLSMALNRMSKKLKDYVGSLEKTNMELRQAQEEVIRSEKLASVGRLAAGVAHEIGNPIGAILGYAHILKSREDNSEEETDFLDRIEAESSRINTIIGNLLDFSRSSKVEVKETDINKIINDTVSLLSPQKRLKGIEMDLQLENNLPPVLVDENQLQQVLINMIMNAGDAMSHKGRLTLQTNLEINQPEEDSNMSARSGRRRGDPPDMDYSHLRRNASPPEMRHDVKKVAPHLMIRVSDTGSGIKKEDLSKIFDPFFTTKPPGKGTGLGLTNSLRIIESFNGEIKVESEEGQGTTFVILLPMGNAKKS